MSSECMTVRYLRQMADREECRDPGLAAAAGAALSIVADLREHYMTERDASILHLLVDEIRKSGHDVLLEHFRREAPDCDMCAALAARASA